MDEVNSILREFAIVESEKRMAEYADMLDEERMNYELIRQHEAMENASQLEDFSPFDTCNS